MRALYNLYSRNMGRGAGMRCETGDDAATIYVYDVIGGWDGVAAAELAQAISAITAPAINLRINSPGGDVFEARAIKTALEQHPARVTAYVDGLAASAASFLMLAADEIRIAPGAFVMIHNPWGFAVGDAREMRATAQLLDRIGATLVADYSGHTGLPTAAIAQMMDDETWLEASDAVAKGFATSVMEKPARGAAAQARAFDLSAYVHAPVALAGPSPEQVEEERRRAEDEAFAALKASYEIAARRLAL